MERYVASKAMRTESCRGSSPLASAMATTTVICAGNGGQQWKHLCGAVRLVLRGEGCQRPCGFESCCFRQGTLIEWIKVPVLKTGEPQGSVSSNLTGSAKGSSFIGRTTRWQCVKEGSIPSDSTNGPEVLRKHIAPAMREAGFNSPRVHQGSAHRSDTSLGKR